MDVLENWFRKNGLKLLVILVLAAIQIWAVFKIYVALATWSNSSDKLAFWQIVLALLIPLAIFTGHRAYLWFFKPTWKIEVKFGHGNEPSSEINFRNRHGNVVEQYISVRNSGKVPTESISIFFEFCDKGTFLKEGSNGRFTQRGQGVLVEFPLGIIPSLHWDGIGVVKALPGTDKEGFVKWTASGNQVQDGTIPYKIYS